MLFNSLEFLLFFPAVVALYGLLPIQGRGLLLLAASYLFYAAWEPYYLFLILFSTGVDYFVARALGVHERAGVRKFLLGLSVTANLGLLFTFKYADFFLRSARVTLAAVGVDVPPAEFNLLLPVGISFYTFQTMGYTIDVYRRRIAPEKNIGKMALYVAFFPQLVAGPIERAERLLPQLGQFRALRWESVRSGLGLMLWGFWKKLVVADRLAIYVDAVYGDPTAFQGAPLILATYFFAFQIYCDFSGYTDIAIGTARIFNVDLMQNFRSPYFSRSIREFWGRWHISLSTWFRDYVYIPLGGNRAGPSRWYANLLVVFVLSGLWHGAAWTFVVWGLLHGLYLVIPLLTTSRTPSDRHVGSKPSSWIGIAAEVILTFHLVLIAWVLFRSESLQDALYILSNGLQIDPGTLIGVPTVSVSWFLTSIGLVLALLIADAMLLVPGLRRSVTSGRLGWGLAYAGLMSLYLLGVFEKQTFIYFQF